MRILLVTLENCTMEYGTESQKGIVDTFSDTITIAPLDMRTRLGYFDVLIPSALFSVRIRVSTNM